VIVDAGDGKDGDDHANGEEDDVENAVGEEGVDGAFAEAQADAMGECVGPRVIIC
jgi:hypothetical protein